MRMKFNLKLISAFVFNIAAISLSAQTQNFLVLGDIHYDLIEDHDMEWLKTKPDDVRQVKEYTAITSDTWGDFCNILSDKASKTKPPVSAVLQIGDLSEGLAGTPEKAMQMAGNAMFAVENSGIPAPWIITKGNHDITGPGAEDAFKQVYIPAFRKQLNDANINSANYAYKTGEVLFVCFDPWDKEGDPLQKLEDNLKSNDAKYKFVLVHEPVIPVNERCWHLFRTDNAKRNRLLKIIAGNKAIVLSAHLHLYSVVKRNTEYGPIIQIMTNSVVKDRSQFEPKGIITAYGSSLAENVPQWEPKSLEQRIEWLDEEAKHVTYFKQIDLAGYGILTVDGKKDKVSFEYYPAFGNKPYDTLSITDLIKNLP